MPQKKRRVASQRDARSVTYLGTAKGNLAITGDDNKVTQSRTSATRVRRARRGKAENAPDIAAEIDALRVLLLKLKTPDQERMNAEVEVAKSEVAKADPNRDVIGNALERAISYATKATNFGAAIGSLRPHIVSASSWLGQNWERLALLLPK